MDVLVQWEAISVGFYILFYLLHSLQGIPTFMHGQTLPSTMYCPSLLLRPAYLHLNNGPNSLCNVVLELTMYVHNMVKPNVKFSVAVSYCFIAAKLR